MLSEAVAETVIVADTVEPLAGLVIETVGGVVSGVVLLTVTVTAVEVFWFPAASRATAVSVCEPFEAVVVRSEEGRVGTVFWWQLAEASWLGISYAAADGVGGV